MRIARSILLKEMFCAHDISRHCSLGNHNLSSTQGKYNKVQYQASKFTRYSGFYRPMSMKMDFIITQVSTH